MPFKLDNLLRDKLSGFDDIIDVRSPAEFAIDHIPGAVNLPVLDDAERAEVGTTYVQDSRFKARRMGAAIVARNVARNLDGYLADKPATYRPLIYCWRGGQRSASLALVLRQIGWQAETLEGGYRSYRRLVVTHLYETPLPWRLHVLDGNTGTAKTELLGLVAQRGGQVVDLEGLAQHRGSLFGQLPGGGQPSQKMFETRLLQAFAALDTAQPVLVEGESSTIGRLSLPPSVWTAMRAAPRILISAPLVARAEYLSTAYRDICDDAARLDLVLGRLVALRGHERVDGWRELARAGQYQTLAAELMSEHYDPAYQKSRAGRAGMTAHEIRLETLDAPALAGAADRIAAILSPEPGEAGRGLVLQSAR